MWEGMIVKILYHEADSGIYYISTPHGTIYKLGFAYLARSIRLKMTHEERKYAVWLILDARKLGLSYNKHKAKLLKDHNV
jgi:hypothetical protein